jgi:hypothetical protein
MGFGMITKQCLFQQAKPFNINFPIRFSQNGSDWSSIKVQQFQLNLITGKSAWD